jgi:hypothetical protein
VVEQNVDASGSIKVHEQGTVPVQVTNGNLAVQGAVTVSNLPAVQEVQGSVTVANLPAVQEVHVTNPSTTSVPLDTQGRVKTAGGGRLIPLQLDGAHNPSQPQTLYVDTSDCRGLIGFVQTNATTSSSNSLTEVWLMLSYPGAPILPLGFQQSIGAVKGAAAVEGPGGGTYVFGVNGLPLSAPQAALWMNIAGNQNVQAAYLYCMP